MYRLAVSTNPWMSPERRGSTEGRGFVPEAPFADLVLFSDARTAVL